MAELTDGSSPADSMITTPMLDPAYEQMIAPPVPSRLPIVVLTVAPTTAPMPAVANTSPSWNGDSRSWR